MFYKNWPYWLKGGAVLTAISFICFALFFVFETLEDSSLGNFVNYGFWGILRLVIGIVGMPIGLVGWALIWGDNGPPVFLSNPWLQIILGFVLWFLVGAAAGFIYGKIKSKDRN